MAGPLAIAQTVSDTRPEITPAQTHAGAWWPNRGSDPRDAYTGPEVCARCHASIARTWSATQMAHAIEPAADSQYLRANPDMSFQRGKYTYRIARSGNQSIYSVTDGAQTLSVPLLWAYGVGVVGQAFIFRLNGTYYESEAAYYPVLHRLSVVAGLSGSPPPTLPAAFGLPLVPVAAQQCISCHTTAAVTDNQLRVDEMIRGVTCEACHGPGARHVSLMEERAKSASYRGRTVPAGAQAANSLIFNPATLAPPAMENFCGACHRTSALVIAEGLHGLDTVHYEPYRLEMSQCWIMTRRITCVTCHDPHQPLQREAAYDSACLSCHPATHRAAGAVRFGKACPVATHNCATCHMPKCRLPRAPFVMSDHFIRIVAPADPCAAGRAAL
ncbi:MAG: multiheme c-type cytochrome [Terriglobia bacterium]